MLNRIIKFSLENRLLILAGAVLLIVSGIEVSRRMDIDVFPDLTAPTVVVMTDAGGMAAEEIERLVTFPIETAVNGATDVRRVRSSSMQGYSFVWIEFDWGTDVFRARQIVGEKMAAASAGMPEGIRPALAPQSSVMGEILFIGLQVDSARQAVADGAKRTSLTDLRTLAEWNVKPAILAAGGVSQVTIIGGDYRQYQVLADPQRMKFYRVGMEELAEACRGISENASGGIVRDYGNEYMVRGMGRTSDVEALGETPVKTVNGRAVTVGDVADVVAGSAVRMGTASQDARPAVIISVSKQPNVNTLQVTENIEQRLAELQETLPPDVTMDTKIFRQADFIETSVRNVGRALAEGAVFVVAVLFLFLASWRTTVISVIAIPLSLLATVLVLHLLGMNINTMSLGGMCIAIGSLVDDAIIDVENVYRRLRQNRARPSGARLPATQIIFDASREIRASILNATFIIIVAFVPLFFLSGMEGRMLKPLGITYVIALFMSLIVAMTVTPLMCSLMLSGDGYLQRNEKDGWLSRNLSSLYRRALHRALRRRKPILIGSGVLLAASIALFFCMGRSFLPEFNEGALTIGAVCKPGISLTESDRLGGLMEEELLGIAEVESTARRTGRGELDEHSQPTNASEIDVRFRLEGRSREAFMADVRSRLAGVPGVAVTVGQPLGHRIDHILSGTRANIAVKIFGSDLNRLFSLGNEIKGAIAGVPGLADVSVEQQTEVPQLQIRASRAMLSRYGISMERFNRFVSSAFSGEKVGEIYEGQRSFDFVLKLRGAESLEGIRSALMDTGTGGKVPLEEVAEIVSVTGPNAISRENVQRKIVVSVNIAGRDLGSAAREIEETVARKITLPEGYRIVYGGQFESARRASGTLLTASLLAIAVIFLLLYMEFKSARLSGVILLNLPLALIGGVFAVFFSSGVVSIPSIIGFITLFGIATRNGILLVSGYQHLRERNAGMPLREVIVKGSTDRLNAILMTALTAGLALLPLVFNGDRPGNEIQSPMAVVILGGLLTSTLLNIFIVPMMYEKFENLKISKQ
ncbi:MAG: CusA/CzcA family heavy metal efflux RND transporter [Tannerella sp.]|jgi:CzcA family heavy metal efflux pump|nr:CusA/CzcA family heavy metal efflux RND transporter [Tannerella sp.]